MVDLACQQPSALGYPHAVWTYSLLRDHIQGHAAAAGYPALARVTRGMVHAMLTEAEIQPHRIRYYLERRDPEFEAKMAQVLTVYKEVAIANERGPGTDPERPWVVTREALASQGRNSPFLGLELAGRVATTIVDGRVVYPG